MRGTFSAAAMGGLRRRTRSFVALLIGASCAAACGGGEEPAVVEPAVVEAAADEPLLDVVERISREGADLAVVSHEGGIVGIVTLEIVESLVLFRGALHQRPVARTMQTSVA